MKRLWLFFGRCIYYVGGVIALPIFLNGTQRVRVAIIDPGTNRILLAQTWISAQRWNLVGGGIHQDEDMFVAAIREVKEETGLDIQTRQLRYISELTETEYMATFTSHIFLVNVSEQPVRARFLELSGLEWFKLTDLPQNHHVNAIKLLNIKSSQQRSEKKFAK